MSQSFVCLLVSWGVCWDPTNRFNTAFYGPVPSQESVWQWSCLLLFCVHYLNLGCLCQMSGSFVQNLSFLLKEPIRVCRRVRVYSPH